jgi:hypothetical protein
MIKTFHHKATIMDIQKNGLQPVINAQAFPHLKSTLLKILTDGCNNLIVKSGLGTFQKLSNEDKKARIDALFALCVERRFSWMIFSDLQFIINRGLIGEYGEFFDLTPRELNRWIKAYQESNAAAITERNKPIYQAKQQEPEEDHETWRINERKKTLADIDYLKEKYGQLDHSHFTRLGHQFDYGYLLMMNLQKAGIITEPEPKDYEPFIKEGRMKAVHANPSPFMRVSEDKVIREAKDIAKLEQLARLINEHSSFLAFLMQNGFDENGLPEKKQQTSVA